VVLQIEAQRAAGPSAPRLLYVRLALREPAGGADLTALFETMAGLDEEISSSRLPTLAYK
jgi:hypothetical protein